MKKILFLMAMLPIVLFTACSSDDENNDYENRLVGIWVEDTELTFEVFNLELKSDHSGYFWATDDGVIDEFGKQKLKWSATENTFTSTFEGEKTETINYQIVNGKLHLGEIVYVKK